MKKTELVHLTICIIFLLILSMFPLPQRTNILAEQSGSSPESGTDSYIKTAYDWLVAKGTNYGNSDAVDWINDWGTYWNRIMESAAWEPGGDLSVSDVFYGKTFYGGSNDRDVQTGTLDQSLVEYDDYKGGDSEVEEASWIKTSGEDDTGVWQDQRTGLYWSASQGQMSNIFPDQDHSACDFFNTTLNPKRGDYETTDPQTTCGNAINACADLSLDADSLKADGDAEAETDWYLPSQKELMMAYIDGIYNQTNTTFASASNFWSSTEGSDGPSYAWRVYLHNGYTYNRTKITATNYVRCVRRNSYLGFSLLLFSSPF